MAASMDVDVNSASDFAISFINEQFPNNTDSLAKLKPLQEQFSKNVELLQQQLSFVSAETPGRIDSAVKEAEETTEKINHINNNVEILTADIDNHVADVSSLVKKLSSMTDQIKELEKYSKYLQVIGRIEDFSSDIQSAMLISAMDRAVLHFADMAELTKALQSSRCQNLVQFSQENVKYWYQILSQQLTQEFEEVLTAWRWPFIVTTVQAEPLQNIPELRDKLSQIFTQLLHLQLPEGLEHREGTTTTDSLLESLPQWRPLLLPIHIMLKSLRKRFKYHFTGHKQTNCLDKPEWYLTTTLTWVKDHKEFLFNRIQPLLDKAGLNSVDAVVEFSRGLVELVMRKMDKDIEELVYDDGLFSHLVDEALSFDSELRNVYGYPTSQPGCLHILTQPVPFNKWITIERKIALEKMDQMLSSPRAWQSQYKEMGDIDDLKVPECGESFMTLLLTITERYKHLPYPQHKLHFLDLQLDLLDDYRIRLLQVKADVAQEPCGACYCAILNTTSYITEVLHEWSELLFFLQLQYHRSQYGTEDHSTPPLDHTSSAGGLDSQATTPSHDDLGTPASLLKKSTSRKSVGRDSLLSAEDVGVTSIGAIDGSVFDEMLELLHHLKDDMITNIVSYVFDDVKARSKPYRKDRWPTLPSQKEVVSLALSNSACEMFLVLKEHLRHMQAELSKSLFREFWLRLAEQLNVFIYEDVILRNHFNDGGTAQINFDMTRNLFPLFGQFTQKPENYFKDVKESCILLTLNVGSAILLKEVIYCALHERTSDARLKVIDPVAALHDIGVFKLSPEDAELVFSLRTNLTT